MKIEIHTNPEGRKVVHLNYQDPNKDAIAVNYTISAFIDEYGQIDVYGTIKSGNDTLMYSEQKASFDGLKALVEVADFMTMHLGDPNVFGVQAQMAIVKYL